MRVGGVIKNKAGRVRWGWVVFLGYVAAFTLTGGATGMLVDAVRTILMGTSDISADGMTLSSLASYIDQAVMPLAFQLLWDGCLVVAALAFWVGFLRHPARGLGFPVMRAKASLKRLGAGIAMAVVMVAAVMGVVALMGKVETTFSSSMDPLWFFWLLMSAVIAFTEELFYRGFVIGAVRRDHDTRYAVVASAAVFGVIHLANPNLSVLGTLNIVLAGVLLALLYVNTGSLWAPIGFHFAWNTLQGMGLGLPISGLDQPSILITTMQGNGLLTGGAFGFEASLVTTVLTSVAVGLLVWYGRRNARTHARPPS